MSSEAINIKDAFYLKKEEPIRGCLLALRSVILTQDSLIAETIKYGMPCFCYKNKMFCYLWIDKKINEPYILIVEGKLLNHPELESGSRARMKIFRIDPNADLPIDTINSILRMGLSLYREGIIKTK